jgi:protein-S-isoprenylcysteine O-methyltransferase Ste14
MSDDARGAPDNPGVVAPPPLIYAGALGLVANRLYPIAFLPRAVSRVLGLPLIFGGLTIGLLGFREMRRAETNVDPYKPATAIVTEGPYRFTRNPLYVGMTLVYSGITALFNAFPAAMLLPLALAVMRGGVIEREERYLERKFGGDFVHHRQNPARHRWCRPGVQSGRLSRRWYPRCGLSRPRSSLQAT